VILHWQKLYPTSGPLRNLWTTPKLCKDTLVCWYGIDEKLLLFVVVVVIVMVMIMMMLIKFCSV